MPYAIIVKPAAQKQIHKLPRAIQLQITTSLNTLIEMPRPQGVEKLIGQHNLYRIRTGNYRIIYQINDKALLVLVVKVGRRRDVYQL